MHWVLSMETGGRPKPVLRIEVKCIVMKVLTLIALILISSGLAALEPIENRDPTFWLGPEVLDPGKARIGQKIKDVPFEHLYGGKGAFYEETGKVGTVVVVRDPECPVSQRYGPRVAKLARSYTEKGFSFIYIYLNNTLSAKTLLADASRLYTPGVAVGEGSFNMAEQLGVTSTGDVFLLDKGNTLVYRGAVDDQYGFGYTREAPTANYLRNAMDSLLEEKQVEVPATSAPGCIIDADPQKDHLFPDIPFDAVVS